jgi:iron complex outermembrane recepter protein
LAEESFPTLIFSILSMFFKKTMVQMGIACISWLACCLPTVQGQMSCDRILKGQVRTDRLGEAVPFASIYVRAIGQQVLSDEQGRFAIGPLCPDRPYLLEVHVRTQRFEMEAFPGLDSIEVRVSNGSTALEAIEITSFRTQVAVKIFKCPTTTYVSADKSTTQGLADLVRQLPGVSMVQSGANIAKPVVQGLHSNRIAIVNNGVVLESQQWGREHAPEVDLFSAQTVAVVKGAAGVQYGVGALGGAVVMDPAPLRPLRGVGGWVALGGFSNGRAGAVATALDFRSTDLRWAGRIQASGKRGGNLRAPDYWLHNTGHAELNVSAMAAFRPNHRWKHEAYVSRVAQQLAILRASHLGNVDQILLASQLDTPMNNIDRFTYRIGRPYQAVEHYTARWRTVFWPSDQWEVTAQFVHQFNHRREYDVVRKTGSAATRAQVSFRLWTNTLDLSATHHEGHWKSSVGVQAFQALNYVNRGAFIPDYNSWGVSAWATEQWKKEDAPIEWDLGLRYDLRGSHVTTTGNGSRNLNEHVRFGNFSGTTGLLYHWGKGWTAALTSGMAWRPPSVYELFARGVHQGAGTYEEGDSSLVSEKAWNSNITFQYAHPKRKGLTASLMLYYNNIRDFIYIDPLNSVKVTVRGPFPAYLYRQANARLYGLDAMVSLPLWGALSVELQGALLWADRLLDSIGEKGPRYDPLPLMPSNRAQYGLKWQKNDLLVRAYAQSVARQHRVPAAGLLRPAPDGYTLFGLEIQQRLQRGTKQWEIALSVQNLFNTRYREYLNFFRFYADEPGTNVGAKVKYIF